MCQKVENLFQESIENTTSNMKNLTSYAVTTLLLFSWAYAITILFLPSCDVGTTKSVPTSDSRVKKASAQITVGSDGLTTEQRNVRERLLEDNKPGSIKHLYIISAYSGETLIYSTVRGKVTSSGKRLTPTSIETAWNNKYGGWEGGDRIRVGEKEAVTHEVLQDDGTYGSSIEYVYWWDSRGAYHQHYISGGQIVHVSNQPVAVKSITINMELSSESRPSR